MFAYRGFEIHARVAVAFEGKYNVFFQIRGGGNVRVMGNIGAPTQLHSGPFALAEAYLVAEGAGQAAVDAVIGPNA